MKAALLLLVLISFTATGQTTKVNNILVDLGPLNAWLNEQSHTNSRPLPHWKVIQVYELKEQLANWTKATIKGETGQKAVWLDGVPSSVKTFLSTFNERAQAISQLTAQIVVERQRVQALYDRYLNTPSDASGITIGTAGFVEENQWTRLADYRAAQNRFESEKDRLEQLKSEYDAALANAQQQLTALAMYTGRVYAGLEIWACGPRIFAD